MSLDVYLLEMKPLTKRGTGVFIREGGTTKELSPEEVSVRFPDAPPIEKKEYVTNQIFGANITHNLNAMAREAGLYEVLWRPYLLTGYKHTGDHEKDDEYEDSCDIKAKNLIAPIETGLKNLKSNPGKFKKYNPENGWGSYEGLVKFTENYLKACREYPDAKVEVSR